MVCIAKGVMRKSVDSGKNLNLSLLNHRNGAVAGFSDSPDEILMGRVLQYHQSYVFLAIALNNETCYRTVKRIYKSRKI